MEYIKANDYDYIINKFHHKDLLMNEKTNRFIRNDSLFDDESGLPANVIKEQILVRDKKISYLPHPVRKAEAFAYILKNTRISCDKRDPYPAVNCIDRPLNDTLIPIWRDEALNGKIPDIENKRLQLERDGIVTIWPDYDHSVPYWDRLFDLGFSGILFESERIRNSKENLDEEQTAFFDGIKITYSAIIEFLERLYNKAEQQENFKMAKALHNLKSNPPETFYEALLLDYIYFILCEHIEGLQVRSLCNFDRLLYKFYLKDLENGSTEEDIRTELAYFLLQFASINNYWGQPVFLGGCKEDESTVINELSYIFLDVYDKMCIMNPKIQIKIAESTPKDFTLKALDMIRRGNNSIVFVSDKLIRKALEKMGISKNDARLANVKGCYEFSVQGGLDIGMNYVNLLKPLEYAMHEGCDGVKNKFAGRKSPKCDEYLDFEEFYNEYKEQLKFLIDTVVDVVNVFEDYLAEINPQSMLSATFPSCLEKGKDALGGGGSRNESSMAYGFIADIADSLTAIKTYVFDKKELTLSELRDILDKNYEGHEKFRLKVYNDKNKYGNNKALPDFFAKDIAEFAADYVCGRKNSKKRDGVWSCGFHVARQSYDQGAHTAASPNGRLKGEELSKNMSASMGQNREGATAAILSLTKIDASKFGGDACLDLGLLPSAVKGDDGIEAMYGLLQTFINRGGHAMHINVFDAETLRKAQKEPEKYTDLQIRVCGWNVLFNNICKTEQDGFIKQAESLI